MRGRHRSGHRTRHHGMGWGAVAGESMKISRQPKKKSKGY